VKVCTSLIRATGNSSRRFRLRDRLALALSADISALAVVRNREDSISPAPGVFPGIWAMYHLTDFGIIGLAWSNHYHECV
jgi:hypothetical protein